MAQNTLLDFLQGASNSAASNVSAPIDGLNWLLRKAGMPVSDKPFLGSDWMAQKGLTVQPQNKMAGLLGESFGGVAPIVAAAKAPQIARGLLQAGENAIAPSVLRKESGMFVGPSAKTWDAQAASKAQQMAAQGVDPRKVWSETGTWKGPDGMWRQEIPDKTAALMDSKIPAQKTQMQLANEYLHKNGIPTKYDVGSADSLVPPMIKQEAFMWAENAAKRQKPVSLPLDDVLHHPDLYGSYPDFASMPISKETGGALRGSFNENTKSITTGGGFIGDSVGPRSTTLHELQHAIQQREGFARGGSPNDPSLMPHVRKMYAENIDAFQGEGHELMNMAKNRAYQNLAGEAEARATQARIPLDAAQRRALFPEDSYDVPMNQLIIRGLLAP